MLQIVLLYALFASTFSLGKVLLNYATPMLLVGLRMTIAGAILLAYQLIKHRSSCKINPRHWKMYLEVILFTCYLPYILRFWGLKHMSPAKASLLYTLGPFVSYLLSYWLCKERITFRKVLGLTIGFLGLLPVLIAPAQTEALVGGIGFFSWAEAYIVLSVSCLSYGWIAMRRLLKEYHYDPTLANGISMFSGGTMALISSMVTETYVPIIDMKSFVLILAVVIVVSNLLCHTIYGMLLKKYTPTFLSFASFLTPLFAALYDWLFFGRAITVDFVISAVCVFVGLAIFYQDSFHEVDNNASSSLIKEELEY